MDRAMHRQLQEWSSRIAVDAISIAAQRRFGLNTHTEEKELSGYILGELTKVVDGVRLQVDALHAQLVKKESDLKKRSESVPKSKGEIQSLKNINARLRNKVDALEKRIAVLKAVEKASSREESKFAVPETTNRQFESHESVRP